MSKQHIRDFTGRHRLAVLATVTMPAAAEAAMVSIRVTDDLQMTSK